MKRPVSVTVISILQIVFSALGILSLPIYFIPDMAAVAQKYTGYSIELNILVALIGYILSITSGILMLKGKESGRKILLYYFPVAILVSLILMKYPFMVLFSVIYYLALLYFLTREHVLMFFRGEDWQSAVPAKIPPVEETKRSAGQKVGAVILLIFGGYIFFTMLFISTLNIGNNSVFAVMLVIFTIIAMVFLIPGVLLWGKEKWKTSSGIVFVVSGLMSVAVTSYMQFFINSDLAENLPKKGMEVFEIDSLFEALLLSIIVSLTGIFLLIYDRGKRESARFNEGK